MHYPFGMTMPGRQFSVTTSSSYRYSFNSKEKDDDINLGVVAFEARIYDSRIGRWFAVEPLFFKFTGNSTYSFAINNPINLVDINGKYTIRFQKFTTCYWVPAVRAPSGIIIGGYTSCKESLQAIITQSPGKDIFYFDKIFENTDKNGKETSSLVSSKEFFPTNVLKKTSITTTENDLGFKTDDLDYVSLAKLSSPVILDYLKGHSAVKYGNLSWVK